MNKYVLYYHNFIYTHIYYHLLLNYENMKSMMFLVFASHWYIAAIA